MKTFNNLNFKPDARRPGCFRASITLDTYTLSVVYGPDMYGKGATHDTYEVAVLASDSDDLLPLSCDNDILGWQNGEEITGLMKILQTEPGFGDCLRVLKRTKYYRQFNSTSLIRDEAFAS